jgi:hypothetical protein
MELIAQRGLPVATAVPEQTLMAGDARSTVAVPLTSGFAPTGYEQDEVAAQAAEAKQKRQ